MRISGIGYVGGGEYKESLYVKGTAKLNGDVKCEAVEVYGSFKGNGNLIANSTVKASGFFSIEGMLSAEDDVKASGSLKVGKSLTSAKNVSVSGGFECGGTVKCQNLKISGGVDCEEGLEAEEITISGTIKCNGIINAENMKIEYSGSSNVIASVGGSRIWIKPKRALINRLPLISKINDKASLKIVESVEGDVVTIVGVAAPLVTGRVVNIGAGCEVDKVTYSEGISIDPDAIVKSFEKIG